MTYDTQFRHDMGIIREAKQNCMLYSSSYNARYYYPFKLHKANGGWDSLETSCLDLMIDSNISDEETENKEIIEYATDVRANTIIPKDYLHQPERTLNSTIEFQKIIDDNYSDFRPNIMPVLQEPHVEHLKEHQSFYKDYNYIAIGGIKGNSHTTEEKVDIIRGVRDIVGDNTHIHGFGIGCSLGLIKAIRSNPNLLDSLDMASAEEMVKNGKVTDWKFNQQQPEIPMPYGEEKTTVNAGFSKSILVMLNYMITDRVNESKLKTLFEEELGLHKVMEITAAAQDTEVNDITIDEQRGNMNTVAPGSDEQEQLSQF